MATLEWSPIEQADLRGLVHLAEACLHADGGYPPLATDEYIQALFMSDVGIAGRDDTTDIVAAAPRVQGLDAFVQTAIDDSKIHPK